MGQVPSQYRISSGDHGVGTRRRFWAFVLLTASITASCDRTSPAPPAVHQHAHGPEPDAPEQTFGDDTLSFVSWLEANGSFVVVHQFDRDTNGDGELDPKFGDHGEPEGDWPSVWIYPLPGGEPEQFDELVTSDPANRWAVLRRGDALFAVSASKRWTLEGADPTPDPSRCAPARQASIDPTSSWLTFIRRDPDRAVVKNLSTGSEREVAAEGLLWRADAMPRGWVMLREVVADTDGDGEIAMPWREGTCICRWCSRFASSVGRGRLVGDESREVMVDTQNRRATPPIAPIPLAADAVWSMADNKLTTFDGSGATLGSGCAMRLLPLGTDRVVANCGGEFVVWNATTGESVAVERPVNALQPYSPPTAGWVAVQFTDDEGTARVGRLNLGDGRIEAGPPAVRWGAPHPSGWRLVADATTTHAWDIGSGSSTTLDFAGAELDGLLARRDGKWLVVDPHKPMPAATLDEQPRFVASNGCYVAPHPYNQPVRGPFELICW